MPTFARLNALHALSGVPNPDGGRNVPAPIPVSMPLSISRRRLLQVAGASAVGAALPLGFSALADDAPTGGVFHPVVSRLDNGMDVVVVRNTRAPVAMHMVWYRAGAADEPEGKSGIAHFLEHLMFKGTKTLGPGEASRLVAGHGGQENAFTSQDYTGYFQFVARDRLEAVMEIEADRMVNLVLPAVEVERERLVILEERRTRTDNQPRALFWEQMMAALYLNHPYRLPIIGWKHEMEGLTKQDAYAFYERFYAPDNAILVVAGDVDPAAVRRLAEKHYGPAPSRNIPPRVRPAEPPHRAARRLAYRDPRVRQAAWGRAYIAPSYNRGESRHAYALQLMDEIFGSSATSRLYQSLVVDKKLATSIGSGYDASRYDLSYFYVFGIPADGVSPEKLEAAVDEELASLVEKGVTDRELSRALQRQRDAAIFARDNLRSAAMSFGIAATTGRGASDVEAWPERIAAVTAADVKAAAAHVVDPRGSVTGVMLPARPDGPVPTSSDN